ncbi:MAG TPA: serine hydrolase [Anaerolineales bacterium]|nr:serine hydrolase [Anaerolineales bacterium]
MANNNVFKRTNPEAEGISSIAVLDFIRAVEQHNHPLDAVQGFMLLRHGNVAAEGWWSPYGPEHPHTCYSLSKSFTSTAIGLAVAEGRLTVDDPVLKYFPDDAPANPGENLKAMCVRHLLSMNTGHGEDTTLRIFRGEDDNWARAFLALPVEYQPGTWFVYNTAATYMLSAIITQLTGGTLLDYLRPRLLDPLGIENPFWETDPRGINLGGTGLHIKTEEIARFGQLYLQRGMWQGKRIVPEGWIVEATQVTSDNSNTQTNPDWAVGYGYQFWRCRHNAYRGDGAFGQFCIVMPEQEAVLTMIGGVQEMQAVLDKVWEHLLPAMQPEALPENSQAYNELCDKLDRLPLPLANGQAASPGMEQWSGKTYTLETNHLMLQSAAIEFGDTGSTLTLRNDRGEHLISIGQSAWLQGTSDWRGRGKELLATSGAWTAEDTYEVRICCNEDAYCPILRFNFNGSELRLEVSPNATWDWEPAGITRIIGRVTVEA